MIKFMAKEGPNWTVVSFELEGGVIEPKELGKLNESIPDVNPKKGVVISGRGPTWLFSAIAHLYHPTIWVANYDPRLGAVVVQTHVLSMCLGDIIDIT